jgi:hypothetical protein
LPAAEPASPASPARPPEDLSQATAERVKGLANKGTINGWELVHDKDRLQWLLRDPKTGAEVEGTRGKQKFAKQQANRLGTPDEYQTAKLADKILAAPPKVTELTPEMEEMFGLNKPVEETGTDEQPAKKPLLPSVKDDTIASKGEGKPDEPEEKEAPASQDDSGTTGGARPSRRPLSEVGRNGRSGNLILNDGTTHAVRYHAVEADELLPSHDARRSFLANAEAFPNERPYEHPMRGAADRAKVLAIAAADPSKIGLLVEDSSASDHGPPIVTPDGLVLGGNGRAMGTQLGYRNGGEAAQRLKQAMVDAAAKFGLDPKQLAEMKQPVIVRAVQNVDARSDWSTILNESLATGRSQAVLAVSRGKKISEGTAALVSSYFTPDESGEVPTLAEVLRSNPKTAAIINALRKDGAWTHQDFERFTDPKTREPNDDGKTSIEKILLGRVVPDAGLLDSATAGVKQKLLASIGPLTRGLQDATHGKELAAILHTAIEAFPAYKAADRPAVQYFHEQQGLFDTPGHGDEAVSSLVDALDKMGPRKFANGMLDVLRALKVSTGDKQASMFGGTEAADSAHAAIVDTFGTNAIKAVEAARLTREAAKKLGEGGTATMGLPLDEESSKLLYAIVKNAAKYGYYELADLIEGVKERLGKRWNEDFVPYLTEQWAKVHGDEKASRVPAGVFRDVNAAAGGFAKVWQGLRQAFAPGGVSGESKGMAGIIREGAAELAKRHEQARFALDKFGRMLMKLPLLDRYKFINGVEQGTKQTTPQLDAAAKAMRTLLDEARDRIIALGKGHLDTFIENYFPHIWKDPAKAEQVFGVGKRPLEGSKAFLKQRTIPTTVEGLAKGLEPISDNPVDLVLLKLHEMNRFEMGQKVLQEGKDGGYVKLARSPAQRPADWVKIDDKIGTVWERRPTTKQDGSPGAPEFIHRGEYYAHPDAGRILNNYLSPGLHGNAVYDAIRFSGNAMNMAQLGLSFFHVTGTAINSIVSRTGLAGKLLYDKRPLAAAKMALRAWVAPLDAIIGGGKVIREALQPGSQGGDFAQVVDALQAGGHRLGQDRMYRLGRDATTHWDAFLQALKEGRPRAVPLAFLGALEQLARPMMEWYIPRMKQGVLLDLARYELAKLPADATRTELRERMRDVVDSVDN